MIENTLERIATALEQMAAALAQPATAAAPAAPAQPVAAEAPAPAHTPTAEPEAPAPAAPAADAAPTLDATRARFIALSTAGRREELLALLAEHGAKTLPDLDAAGLAAVNAALDKMDAAA